MDCPELYVKDNGMQQRDASEITSAFVKKMIWKPNEVILDIGCGPGDVTSNILHQLLKDKIKKMVSFNVLEIILRTFLILLVTIFFRSALINQQKWWNMP